MKSAKFKVMWIKDKGNYKTLGLKPLEDLHEFEINPKYGTIIVNGAFSDYIKQYSKYTFTISDYPNQYGNYKLIFEGRLPIEHTFATVGTFVDHSFPFEETEDYEEFVEMRDGFKLESLRSLWTLVTAEDYKESIKTYNAEILDKNCKKIINILRKSYKKTKGVYNFLQELYDMGVTNTNTQYTIINNLKKDVDYTEVIATLKENPYLLVDMADMNIKAVDCIAIALGVKADDLRRISAITESNLRLFGESGKTWVTIEQYLKSLDKSSVLYGYDTSIISFDKQELVNMIEKSAGDDSYWIDSEKNRIASRKYFELEKQLYEILKSLDTSEVTEIPESVINKAIDSCQKREKITYLQEQKDAIKNCFKSNVSVVSGPAGTGKSTVARAVVEVYRDRDITTTALSGKASQRIGETTGVPGRTMHSIVGSLQDKYIPADLIILDEASMVGLDIVLQFFSKIKPGTHIVILGDHCQLTVIGTGNFFSDMLHSKTINVSIIEEVHRQALDSNIIKFATQVRHQIRIDDNVPDTTKEKDFIMLLKKDDNEITTNTINMFDLALKKYKVEDIMLVTPTRLNAYNINNLIQNILKEKSIIKDKEAIELELEDFKEYTYKIYPQDRVINIKNSYDVPATDGGKLDVMNGALGTFIEKKKVKISKKKFKEVYLIDFDGIGVAEYNKDDMSKILLGYCITVHKSQGSQAKLLIYNHPAMCNPKLCCTEMVYTAVTRARDMAIVIGTRAGLNKAIETKELNSKQTLLREFLDAGCIQEDLHIKEKKPFEKTSLEVVQEAAVDTDLKPFIGKEEKKEKEKEKSSKKTKTIDSKTRAKYDKNNAQKRAKRRNEAGLLAKEQAKQDKINLIKKLYVEGKTQKEIVELTGFAKGTVSRYLRL